MFNGMYNHSIHVSLLSTSLPECSWCFWKLREVTLPSHIIFYQDYRRPGNDTPQTQPRFVGIKCALIGCHHLEGDCCSCSVRGFFFLLQSFTDWRNIKFCGYTWATVRIKGKYVDKKRTTYHDLLCRIAFHQYSYTAFARLLHPGRLTWNLPIPPFRKEHDLPNLHDYVRC